MQSVDLPVDKTSPCKLLDFTFLPTLLCAHCKRTSHEDIFKSSQQEFAKSHSAHQPALILFPPFFLWIRCFFCHTFSSLSPHNIPFSQFVSIQLFGRPSYTLSGLTVCLAWGPFNVHVFKRRGHYCKWSPLALALWRK